MFACLFAFLFSNFILQNYRYKNQWGTILLCIEIVPFLRGISDPPLWKASQVTPTYSKVLIAPGSLLHYLRNTDQPMATDP